MADDDVATPPMSIDRERLKTAVMALSASLHVSGTKGYWPAKPVLSFIGFAYLSEILKKAIVQNARTETIQIEFQLLFGARSVAMSKNRYNP